MASAPPRLSVEAEVRALQANRQTVARLCRARYQRSPAPAADGSSLPLPSLAEPVADEYDLEGGSGEGSGEGSDEVMIGNGHDESDPTCCEQQLSSSSSDSEVEDCTPCEECGITDPGDDEMLLCDGKGCSRAYHMLCLKPPLGSVPEGEWLCPICLGTVEELLDVSNGTRLYARDKKGFWGVATVLSSREVSEGREVHIRFQGFCSRYNEDILVGSGRLRGLAAGLPSNTRPRNSGAHNVYIVDKVVQMRWCNGRTEYLTYWEADDVPTWEPARNFIGEGAKTKLQAFISSSLPPAEADSETQAGGDSAQGASDSEHDAEDEAIADSTGEAEMEEVEMGLSMPPPRKLPKVVPLPESRSWIFLNSNDVVADARLNYIPFLGEGERRAAQAERLFSIAQDIVPPSSSDRYTTASASVASLEDHSPLSPCSFHAHEAQAAIASPASQSRLDCLERLNNNQANEVRHHLSSPTCCILCGMPSFYF